MLAGFAVMLRTPLLVEQLAAWFHSSCWLPLLPWPPSASALELSDHFEPQAMGPVKSSPNVYRQLPETPTGAGVPVAVGEGDELADGDGDELADGDGDELPDGDELADGDGDE